MLSFWISKVSDYRILLTESCDLRVVSGTLFLYTRLALISNRELTLWDKKWVCFKAFVQNWSEFAAKTENENVSEKLWRIEDGLWIFRPRRAKKKERIWTENNMSEEAKEEETLNLEYIFQAKGRIRE